MIRKLEKAEALDLYQNHMKEDFRKEEIPSFNRYRKLIENNIQKAFYYEENENAKGYFIARQTKEYIFILFFAIFPEYRGQGIGSKCIKELEKELDGKTIIIEVESIKNAKSDDEEKLLKRRNSFYENLGFKTIKEINYALNKRNYDIMVLGNKKEAKEIVQFIKDMYIDILKNINLLEIDIK